MLEYIGIFEKCPLFDGISAAEYSKLLACLHAKTRNYRKNEVIFTEGEKARYIGVVLTSSVQISRTDYFGNRSILATVETAELFGESFACAEVAAIPICAEAQTDTTVLLLEFQKLADTNAPVCGLHGKLIFNLLKITASKNLLLHQKLEITAKRTTKEKLMAYLLLQAKKAGSRCFAVPFDRQALADYLEVDRSGLSVEIGKLRRAGVLKCSKNRFELLK
ncbi:MAG: Crp/Fnr family transcriptional regulator [Clostridia bacterium]|nr:Crp/Fnr family transcriptional regulator [Clostridia bacterium]